MKEETILSALSKIDEYAHFEVYNVDRDDFEGMTIYQFRGVDDDEDVLYDSLCIVYDADEDAAYIPKNMAKKIEYDGTPESYVNFENIKWSVFSIEEGEFYDALIDFVSNLPKMVS